MAWNLDDSRPIWPQIKERLMRDIVSGKYPMGSSFPTVRDLAQEAKVNRNTMQRALSELEGEMLVISNRTAGRSVTTDEDLINDVRNRIAIESIRHFRSEMASLGFTPVEIARLLAKPDEEEKGETDK